MKKEQREFGLRLCRLLEAQKIDISPASLARLIARNGGTPVTPQAISSWLNGKHMPKQENMRVLAKLCNVEPYELQYGKTSAVRETSAAWPDALSGVDRLAFEDFLSLREDHKESVRSIISGFAEFDRKRPTSL
jgi:transcriptional regulator with XRE-family HTH domain